MTATAYGPFAYHCMKGDVDLSTATIKAMLVTTGYTFNKDHEFRSSITGEVSGSGYSAGGIVLTGTGVSYDSANDRSAISADDADFGTVTLTGITGIVHYIDLGSAAADILISFHSMTPQSPGGVPFVYAYDPVGIGYLT